MSTCDSLEPALQQLVNDIVEQRKLKKLAEEIQKLDQPVDFEGLQARGVLVKEGAWYRVRDFSDLPEHVTCKIRQAAQDSKGLKVKLYRAKSTRN